MVMERRARWATHLPLLENGLDHFSLLLLEELHLLLNALVSVARRPTEMPEIQQPLLLAPALEQRTSNLIISGRALLSPSGPCACGRRGAEEWAAPWPDLANVVAGLTRKAVTQPLHARVA